MTVVRPRRLAPRGSIEAAGLFLDPALIGEEEARARILALWMPGVQVWMMGGGYLLRFPAVRRLRAEAAWGAPLFADGPSLSAMPLSPAERDTLQQAPGTLSRANKGVAASQPILPEDVIDPARWIDTLPYTLVASDSLGAPPAQLVRTEPVASKVDLRQTLGPRLQEAPALKDFREALRTESSGKPKSQNPLSRLLQKLWRRPATPPPLPSAAGRAAAPSRPLPSSRPAGPSLWQKLLSRLLADTPLSRWIGNRYARYMARLLRMFAEGDLDEALRYALPLSDANDERLAAAWKLPNFSPRNSLSIKPDMPGPTSTMGLGSELFSMLRQIYRDAFDRLVSLNRIDEAAFVLADLLQSNEEAVAFLERHGKFQLAAELAEARKLKPALIVRQWMLAGDQQRAIRVARRYGAFADAVGLLLRNDADKTLVQAVQRIWARSLAEAGNFSRAVDVGSRCGLLDEASEWMNHGIALGGAAGTRLLAAKVGLLPEKFEDIRAAIIELHEAEGPEAVNTRLVFADALLAQPASPLLASLARLAYRSRIRDIGDRQLAAVQPALQSIVEASGDRCLRWDAPSNLPTPLDLLKAPVLPGQHSFDAYDIGAVEIEDAVRLPDGRILVAFGERGAQILNRNGKPIATLNQPAYRLVLSLEGDRAIALAPRGPVWRLSRFDLLRRTAESWCEASLSAWDSSYDGSLWFAGDRRNAFAIDTLSRRFEALWLLPDVGPVKAIASSEGRMCIVTGAPEYWQYELPGIVLRERRPLQPAETEFQGVAVQAPWNAYLAGSGFLLRRFQEESKTRLDALVSEHWKPLTCPGVTGSALDPVVTPDWIGVPYQNEAGIDVFVRPANRPSASLLIRLAGSKRVSLSFSEHYLVLADDRGRLITFDAARGTMLQNLRL